MRFLVEFIRTFGCEAPFSWEIKERFSKKDIYKACELAREILRKNCYKQCELDINEVKGIEYFGDCVRVTRLRDPFGSAIFYMRNDKIRVHASAPWEWFKDAVYEGFTFKGTKCT